MFNSNYIKLKNNSKIYNKNINNKKFLFEINNEKI